MSLYLIVFYIQLLFRAGLFCRWIWKEIYDDEFYWSIQVFSRVSLYYQAFINQSSAVCAERLSDFTPVETCSSGSVCVWLVRICPDVHVCHENLVSLWKSTNKFCLNDVTCGAGFSQCVCLRCLTEYSFACMRVGTYACVYVCLFVFVYVSGRASDSTSLIISVDPRPTNMPCRWRMPPVRWWFLAPGQDARVSAGPLSAVAWRGLALLALLGPDWGVGGLWVSGPRARSALVWSAAGGACGLAATAPWGVYTVAVGGPTFGLSSALFWVEAAVVPAVVLLGVPCPGGPRMFGARVFSVPASCLAGWGCCSPHTLLNIYMEEPYEHKRAHTHRCTLKHSHWCKNRCSQTHIVLICCCFKTYFVILVMCAAQ